MDACQEAVVLILSFVIPYLDYSSVVWHNCGAVLTTRVEPIQNYALRVILKKTLRCDTKEIRSQLGLPTLEHRRLTSTLLPVHRCLHGHTTNLCLKILSLLITEQPEGLQISI